MSSNPIDANVYVEISELVQMGDDTAHYSRPGNIINGLKHRRAVLELIGVTTSAEMKKITFSEEIKS